MAVDLHPDVVQAINELSHTKLGRRYNQMAKRRYGIRGKTLAAREVAGEFGGKSTQSGRGTVSSAGARGPAQFIPSTRQAYIKQYGIDPWKDDRSAIKAMMIYQTKGNGIESYNPGMPSYSRYILGQRIDPADREALRGGGSPGMSVQGPSSTDVSLGTRTIPGQSFAAERSAAKQQLLLGGRKLSIDSLLQYKQTVNSLQDVPSRKVKGDLVVRHSGGQTFRIGETKGDTPTGARGNVTVAPGANRPGVNLAPITRRAVSLIAGRLGSPLTIGTGTNHSQMTVNGNVSDHWDGHGADIPATGRKLIQAGQAALVTFGMSPKEARRARGGLYNLDWHGRRVQVIFNTHEGGDHTNHLHVGVR